MTPERYQRIGRIFDQALELAPEQRAAFLDQACGPKRGDNAELRAEVENLLAHHSESEEFLTCPAMHVAASLLAQNPPTSAAGKQIKHYQLVSLLGAGGMGEVWLARDSQLERNVALKLLPEQFTRSRTLVRRFAQEAKAASALNHPNIITIHEIGETDGTHYIVTEFVEGQMLRKMLAEPLRLPTVLEIAVQVADALIAAHQAGIVHRDLKPENVMVRPDGLVKVLDFGLAKLTDRGEPGAQAPAAVQVNTDPGTVLGTISYMSPEQALAQQLDHRTDIFSFGVMLYEMVTGHRPFQGASNAAIYDAILHHTPAPIANSQPDLPIELQWIIERALEKKPEQRFQTAAELKAALKTLKDDSGAIKADGGAVSQLSRPPNRRGWIPKAAIAAGAMMVLAIAGYWRWFGVRTMQPLALRAASFTQLTRTPGQEIYPSLSPDGKLLVYTSDKAGNWDIYLQRVSGATPINLTKDSAANDIQPAFSPDGEQIVFRSDREGGGIFVMGATGEKVRRLVEGGYNPAWSPDGREVAYSIGSFARPSERGNFPGSLRVVNVATGRTRQVTETDAVQPNWSPHGDRIAYWGIRRGGQRDIWTIGERGGEPVAVTSDSALDWNPVWSPDGRYLYFASDRGGSMNLWRVPIVEQTGKLLGAPEPVTTPATYSGYISFSRDGRHLAYAQVVPQINLQQVSFDPVKARIKAKPVWITQGSRIATDPDFSPDGEWVVFGATGDKQEDLFIVRRDGTGLRQITDDKYKDRAPRWSPDGRQIVFFSDRSGRYEYWLIKPDGSGLRQFSYTSGPSAQAPVWSPDGQRLLCNFATGPPLIVDANQSWPQQTPQTLPAADAPAELMIWSWSADGRKLVGHKDGIYSYSFDAQRYERLTEFGERPNWLNDNQRLLFFAQDKLYLLDSRSRKAQELLSVAPHQFQSLGISRDNRTVYFGLKTSEANLWLASLEAEP
ncbi:MAG: PD40 domain-containing protein [Acidobacteria bacterium]|nr:PD40 domain-containing protein [Acidobacteriota bacterium]